MTKGNLGPIKTYTMLTYFLSNLCTHRSSLSYCSTVNLFFFCFSLASIFRPYSILAQYVQSDIYGDHVRIKEMKIRNENSWIIRESIKAVCKGVWISIYNQISNQPRKIKTFCNCNLKHSHLLWPTSWLTTCWLRGHFSKSKFSFENCVLNKIISEKISSFHLWNVH